MLHGGSSALHGGGGGEGSASGQGHRRGGGSAFAHGDAVATTAVRDVHCAALTVSPGETYNIGERIAHGLVWSTHRVVNPPQASPGTPLVVKIHHKRAIQASMSRADIDVFRWEEADATKQIENEVKLLSGPLRHPELGFVVPMISFHPGASLKVRGDTSHATVVGAETESEEVVAMIMPDAGQACGPRLAKLSREEKMELQTYYNVLHAHRIVHGDPHPRNWLRIRRSGSAPTPAGDGSTNGGDGVSHGGGHEEGREDGGTMCIIDWGRAQVVREGDDFGEQRLAEEARNLARALGANDLV